MVQYNHRFNFLNDENQALLARQVLCPEEDRDGGENPGQTCTLHNRVCVCVCVCVCVVTHAL